MRNILTVIVFLFLAPLSAQNAIEGIAADTTVVTVKKFDKDLIENYKSKPQFDYSEQIIEYQKSWADKFIDWLTRTLGKFFEMLVGVENAEGIMRFLLQAFPYIVGVLFLYLIIKFFVDRNTTDFISTVKNRRFRSNSEEEELIRNKDLNVLLKEAIAENNFRDAVRYYYLLALKNLDEAQIILWEQQKTNEDFIMEISSGELKDSFAENTRLYDFVWYGDFGLTQEEFVQAEIDFKATNDLIKNKKK